MTNPFETARNASAGMPGHSMSADVGVREADSVAQRFEAVRKAKLAAVEVYGIEWRNLEDVSKLELMLAALNAPTESVKAPEGVIDRPAILVAAQAWWASRMPDSQFVTATIKGNGRVDVHWRDREESGKYTLPVDFIYASPTPITADVKAREGEALARKFHETYERLAPSFGYETREDTKAFDPTTPNGRLMIAVCSALAPAPITADDAVAKEREQLIEALLPFAKAGELFDGEPVDERYRVVIYRPAAGDEYTLTDRHLREARAAIRSLSPDTEGEGM